MAGFPRENPVRSAAPFASDALVSQRALAKDLGVGLGTINFCFQALVEKGLVKRLQRAGDGRRL
jgi:DNA-binding transcriptional regulator YhcF (GntR family)